MAIQGREFTRLSRVYKRYLEDFFDQYFLQIKAKIENDMQKEMIRYKSAGFGELM